MRFAFQFAAVIGKFCFEGFQMRPVFCHFIRGQNRDGGDEALPVEAVDLFLTQDFPNRSSPCVRIVPAIVPQGHQPVNCDWWRTSMQMSAQIM